jgi:NADPH2:quinone reductase
MTNPKLPAGLQLRSQVSSNGELELSLQEIPTPEPGVNEVVVRVQAAPINPSDIGLLFGAADMQTAKQVGTATRPVVTAGIPERMMRAMAGRVGQSMPVGNEGAGTVIAAGSSPRAQAMLGRMVAVLGGAMYSQYRCLNVEQCLLLPAGTTAAAGASCFVNPLTALGMVEAMRREGHTALVHTAAASNLGQMLNKVCIQDGIALVNIVRSAEQEQLLRSQGARHVCNSSAPDFLVSLTAALTATSATIAFDAIGGGKLAGQILTCMEAAVNRQAKEYSRYGSNVFKQVYIYGALDTSPTELTRNFGFTWSVGGWLVFEYLKRVSPAVMDGLKQRVIAELLTTFASQYVGELSLAGSLQLQAISAYGKRATGQKYLIDPSR